LCEGGREKSSNSNDEQAGCDSKEEIANKEKPFVSVSHNLRLLFLRVIMHG
jgi:hypothetical protein